MATHCISYCWYHQHRFCGWCHSIRHQDCGSTWEQCKCVWKGKEASRMVAASCRAKPHSFSVTGRNFSCRWHLRGSFRRTRAPRHKCSGGMTWAEATDRRTTARSLQFRHPKKHAHADRKRQEKTWILQQKNQIKEIVLVPFKVVQGANYFREMKVLLFSSSVFGIIGSTLKVCHQIFWHLRLIKLLVSSSKICKYHILFSHVLLKGKLSIQHAHHLHI